MKKTLLTLTLASVLSANAQIITTVAGIGTAGYSGDDGAATAAKLYNPHGIACDSDGNFYFADYANDRVRKVDVSTDTITTIAGNGNGGFSGDGGAATAAKVYNISGVAIDAQGNLYIAEYGDDRIRKIDTAGIITTVAGNGNNGFSGDGGAATAAKLNQPEGITVDASGNLYIADYNNNRIRKVDAGTGIISTIAGNGTYGYSGDGGTATAAKLANPRGVCIDAQGNLYIADENSHSIRKVAASTGIISTVAGGTQGINDNVAAVGATLQFPYDVVLDASGNLYISEPYKNRIRKVNVSTGIITTVAGNGAAGFSGDGGQATSAQLNSPKGIAFDANGNLYISDYSNNRIRKIAGLGSVGIEKYNNNNSFKIYPNPANNVVSIEVSSSKAENVKIYDMLGNMVITSHSTQIDISNLQSGVYFIKVGNSTQKFIKQ